jgi:uncharacterized protein (DUF58 family)
MTITTDETRRAAARATTKDAPSTPPPRRRAALPRFADVAGSARQARGVGARLAPAWRVVTPTGRAIVGIGLVCWLVAWRTGWAEFAVIASVCVVLAVVCLPFAFGRPLLSVDVALAPDRVGVGARVVGRVRVRNAARARLLPLRVELPVGKGVARFDLPSLGVEEEHEELFTIPTRRRGVIPVGPVTSVRGDALGLYRREVAWNEPHELIVHPALTRLETLGSGFLRDLEGQVTNHLSSSDVAFHTLRDYVPGDDRRFVHWRTSARTGKLMVRQFVDTRRSHAAIVVDLDPASYAPTAHEGDPAFDEFEVAMATAASLAVRILRDEQTLTVLTGRGRVPALTGRHVMDSVARMERDPLGGIAEASAGLTREAAEASIVFLVTGSTTTVGTLRRAIRGISADARVIGIRARVGGRGTFRESGGLTILEVSELADLASLVRAAVR